MITSAERTVKVKDFLKDFEQAIDALKGRFKPDYEASPEAQDLLRRGSDVELRNRLQGKTQSSAWTALGAKPDALAHAYEIAWPVESTTVQGARLNDGELAGRVEQMESDRPASVEVGQLLSQTTKVKETLTKLSLPSAGMPAWRGIESGAEALARAFDLPTP